MPLKMCSSTVRGCGRKLKCKSSSVAALEEEREKAGRRLIRVTLDSHWKTATRNADPGRSSWPSRFASPGFPPRRTRRFSEPSTIVPKRWFDSNLPMDDLAYADDDDLLSKTAEEGTRRLTELERGAWESATMVISKAKTVCQPTSRER